MRNLLRLVLDTNEYLFTIGISEKPSCVKLLPLLLKSYPDVQIFLPRLIFNELKANCRPSTFRNLIKLIRPITRFHENWEIPFSLVVKYQTLGLKEADAFIAAYAQWIIDDCSSNIRSSQSTIVEILTTTCIFNKEKVSKADILVSENRHFLARATNLSFRVVSAAQCLKLL